MAFKCPFCGAVQGRREGLTNHLRHVHKIARRLPEAIKLGEEIKEL